MEAPLQEATRIVRAACTHDCPDACALLVTVRGDQAVDVSPNPAHPITGRHLCVKVNRYMERVYSADRVLTPLRRVGLKGAGMFEPTSWDEALDTIVARWREIMATQGPASILPYSYLGSMGTLSTGGTLSALFHRLGATRLERTVCGGPMFGLSGLVGRPGFEPEDMEHARLIVLWGIDPISKTVHTWDIIHRARQRGARVVVVDPYRSRTADRADEHLPIYPGTDGALALGAIHVIVRDHLEDADYIDRYTTGFDALRAHVSAWTPERVAAITGLPDERVVDFAHAWATTAPACVRFGIGMQRARGAGMALRAIQCLSTIAGQWRHVGGGIASAGSRGLVNMGALERPDLGPSAPRTLNMNQLGRHLTDPELVPPIRALYVWNSNPAVIAADQTRVLRGLARDDLFTVVHEQFLTDTARYADIVLPATTMLEESDLVTSWGFNYVALGEQPIAPRGEAKSNTAVTRLLAARLGFEAELFRMTDAELIDLALTNSAAEQTGATRERLATDGFARVGRPCGVAPHARGQFPTPSGKFEFASADLARAGLGPLPAYVPPRADPSSRHDPAGHPPLRLLTLKRHHSINTSYGGLPVLLQAEPEPRIEIHPTDAAARGIREGAPVRVWNDLGSLTCGASITERVMAGTVALPFGPWQRGGASVNALTSDAFSDLGHGPTFCDNLVDLAPAD
jgi:anaerobic selenocysteine-containing dehydrogenase